MQFNQKGRTLQVLHFWMIWDSNQKVGKPGVSYYSGYILEIDYSPGLCAILVDYENPD